MSDATYRVHVSYHQFHLMAGYGWDGSGMAAFTDGLVNLLGPGGIGVSTGAHSGDVDVRAVVHEREPGAPEPDWAAVSESEIVADDYGLQLTSWDGAHAAHLVDRPGLMRVRVSARGRDAGWAREQGETAEEPETYRIDLWPARENVGLGTLRQDGRRATWSTAAVESAAGRALLSLTADHDDAPHADSLLTPLPLAPGLPPVRVTRRMRFPAPAADLRDVINRAGWPALHHALDDLLAIAYAPHPLVAARADDETILRARPFAATALPAPAVTVREPEPGDEAGDLAFAGPMTEADGEAQCVVGLSAEKVPGGSSSAVGDVYSWLLTRLARLHEESLVPVNPLDFAAVTERPRLRHLADVYTDEKNVAVHDPDLTEALYDATPEQHRAIIKAAARQAAELTGVAALPWVAAALAAVDADQPLPPPFDRPSDLWTRVENDVPGHDVEHVVGGSLVSVHRFGIDAILAADRARTADDPRPALWATLSAATSAAGRPHFLDVLNQVRRPLGLPARTEVTPGRSSGSSASAPAAS